MNKVEGKEKFNHAEAFCLMNYKCEKCGKIELLWNSRDGVTPFGIGCINCNGEMFHSNFGGDKCKEDYIPDKGQRVFIDYPKSLIAPFARRRVAQIDSYNHEEKDDLIKNIIDGFHEDEPYIITI